jgi:UrcA family protein
MNIARLAVAATLAALAIIPASASEMRKVGQDRYVVRADPASIRTAEGRADLLADIEHVATRLCRHEGPTLRNLECRRDVVASMEEQLRPAVRANLHLARIERQERIGEQGTLVAGLD